VEDADNVTNDVELSVIDWIELITPPSITVSELQVESKATTTLLGPEVVSADTAAALREIPAPAHADTIADDKPLRTVLRSVSTCCMRVVVCSYCFQVTGRRNFPRIF
jgi:hypothetical protein